MQGTIATSNGDKLWAFRYSSEHDSRTLFFSTAIDTLRELYPDNMIFQELDEDTTAGRLRAARRPARCVERGARVELRRRAVRGQDELHDFTPIPPD